MKFVSTLGVALLLGAASTATAAPITFYFTGTVTNVDTELSGTFSNGMPLSGAYTFESLAPDSVLSADQGRYAVPPAYALSGQLGSSFSFGGTTGGTITVFNLPGADQYDARYRADATATVNGLVPFSFVISLNDPSATAFASDALPVVPPDLGNFSAEQFALFFLMPGTTNVFRSVSGTITSLTLTSSVSEVPEPASLALLSAGLAGMALRRRRTRSHGC